MPPQHQLDIARTCIAAGKHLLCQKPLADTLPHAAEIVRLARAGGVKLAVNQQLRWGPGLRAARDLIRKGWIGQVVDASIQVSVNTPWHMWPWLAVAPRLEVQYHSIHYIDAMRSILGDPVWVTSRHARNPLQGEIVGETKTITVMDYADDLQALIADNHYNHSDDYFAVFRFIGTEGHITGTLGAMYNYPHGREDTLEWSSSSRTACRRQMAMTICKPCAWSRRPTSPWPRTAPSTWTSARLCRARTDLKLLTVYMDCTDRTSVLCRSARSHRSRPGTLTDRCHPSAPAGSVNRRRWQPNSAGSRNRLEQNMLGQLTPPCTSETGGTLRRRSPEFLQNLPSSIKELT